MYNCTTVRGIFFKKDVVGKMNKMEKGKLVVFVSAVDTFAFERKDLSLFIVLCNLKIMQKLKRPKLIRANRWISQRLRSTGTVKNCYGGQLDCENDFNSYMCGNKPAKGKFMVSSHNYLVKNNINTGSYMKMPLRVITNFFSQGV